MFKSAIFSECRRYRYALDRRWGSGQAVAFIGLNPSTADENLDDPTIRRCIGFAKSWGFDGLRMVNLFAFRATDPSVMKLEVDPIGPDNNKHLIAVAESVSMTIAAWGTHGNHLDRGRQVINLLKPRADTLHYLKRTKDCHPSHPLYLPKHLRPVPWFNDL